MSNNMPLIDIAQELKNIRKVLERMAQAPIFIKDSPLDVREVDKADVAYICDNKACDNCTNDDCMHTTKIEHAWNFEYKDGKYIEVIR